VRPNSDPVDLPCNVVGLSLCSNAADANYGVKGAAPNSPHTIVSPEASVDIGVAVVGPLVDQDTAGFFFPSNTDEEWVQPRRLRVKDSHGTGPQCDHPPVGEADPLVTILMEKLVPDGPVRCLVLAPFGVDLPGNLRGQLIGNALHRSPRVHL
jgi:hypothetical protein